jgi:hypothetical protein
MSYFKSLSVVLQNAEQNNRASARAVFQWSHQQATAKPTYGTLSSVMKLSENGESGILI